MPKLWVFACASLIAFTAISASEPSPPLRVTIVPNQSTIDGTQLLANFSAKDGGVKFEVVLTNTSDHPVVVWEQNCSWGWDCLSFEVVFDGTHQHLATKPIAWDMNYPRPFRIAPGGSFIFHVRIDGRMYPNEWLPEVGSQGRKVNLQAIYTIKPIDPGDTFGQRYAREIWTGSVAGSPTEFSLH